jgi:hypothetical protein
LSNPRGERTARYPRPAGERPHLRMARVHQTPRPSLCSPKPWTWDKSIYNSFARGLIACSQPQRKVGRTRSALAIDYADLFNLRAAMPYPLEPVRVPTRSRGYAIRRFRSMSGMEQMVGECSADFVNAAFHGVGDGGRP